MPDHDQPYPSPLPEIYGLDPGELLARGLDPGQPSAGATHWEPPTPEELAKLLPQYQIGSILGRGGMGVVYKGSQPALDRPVAIKLLPSEVAADGQFISRFQREARTLAKLHHPGIVTVYDFGQTAAGHLYFVMEYVDGTDLRRILEGPGLAPDQALDLISQICEALHAAHLQGVIHRDVKPANILITSDGRVKLADFGLARPLLEEDNSGITMSNVVMGTPDYMSPEQRSGHADPRSDVYALGVMLYEMLTGRRPHGAFEPPSHKVRIDVRLDEVVIKALQEEPDRRYQEVSEMKVDVDHIRTSAAEPVAPSPAPLAEPAPRRFMPAFAAVVVLLALGGGCYFAWEKYVTQTVANAAALVKAQPLDQAGAPQGPAVIGVSNLGQTVAPPASPASDGAAPATVPGIVVTTLAGSAGKAGFSDGPGNAALFNHPNGVAVDGGGNVYVGDTGNFRIRKITPDGVVKTLAGSNRSGNNDGVGDMAQFAQPCGVAVDNRGNVYVGDGCRIRKITPGGVVKSLAGDTNTAGSQDGAGVAAGFNLVHGVAVDGGGNIYAADYNNHTIRKITPEGSVTTMAGLAGVAGDIDGTGNAARFRFPFSVAVDGSGNVYVTEDGQDTLRKISPEGVVTTAARLNNSKLGGVVVDGSGNVYVADTSNQARILKITPDGTVTKLTSGGRVGSRDGTGAEALFSKISSLALDSKGSVYAADLYNHTIRKLTPDGK